MRVATRNHVVEATDRSTAFVLSGRRDRQQINTRIGDVHGRLQRRTITKGLACDFSRFGVYRVSELHAGFRVEGKSLSLLIDCQSGFDNDVRCLSGVDVWRNGNFQTSCYTFTDGTTEPATSLEVRVLLFA